MAVYIKSALQTASAVGDGTTTTVIYNLKNAFDALGFGFPIDFLRDPSGNPIVTVNTNGSLTLSSVSIASGGHNVTAVFTTPIPIFDPTGFGGVSLTADFIFTTP